MQDAVVVAATRTAVGKAPNGALKTVRPDEMAAAVIGEVLRRAPGVDPRAIDDVIMGCAMPEAEQGLNVARIASLRAGVPVDASAVTMNRFCASGLQAIASGAEHIMCGFANIVIAGGTESMSLVPMGGNKVCPNPTLVDEYPDVYLSTGLVAENHARDYAISREEQDAFALRSHQRAVAAIEAGRFAEEITPLTFTVAAPQTAAQNGGPPAMRDVTFAQDEGPRRDTSTDGPCEAATGVSCDRHGDRRQFLADERRRIRGCPDVRSGGERARPGADGATLWPMRPPASRRSASASDRCQPCARCWHKRG